MATLPDEADALYALPLEEFTLARDRLAKKLRDDVDKAAADAVKALRKPSVPAWAVNQVARADPRSVQALFDVGARLQDAQKKLMRGGDAKAVQAASAAERDSVKKLVAAARKTLEAAGLGATESALERVADSFYATSVDAAAREQVQAGRLTKEVKRVGFGDMPDLSLVPMPERPKQPRSKERKAAETAAREAEDAEQAADAAEQRAQELARKADDAKARATEAKEEAKFARRTADQKRREADKLQAKVRRTR